MRFRPPGRTLVLAGALAAAGVLCCLPSLSGCARPSSPASSGGAGGPASTLIAGATIVDGTGAPGRKGSVRIAADKIAEVGDLAPRPGETVVDGTGRVLAPGFVDTHSHADDDIFEHPDALAAVSQGITTVVVGQDGGSESPLAEFFARLGKGPAAVNVASFAGHGTIRRHVMGGDFRRAATEAELERMRGVLDQDLKAGALGLSTGLEYDPGIYSTREEVLALARVAAAAGGRYISHIRSEDRKFWNAIDEIIDIGREAKIPVQVSHIKLAMRSLWGRSGELLRRLEDARASGVDITADAYPYVYWSSTLTVLFPERDFTNRDSAEFVLREVAAPEGLLMGKFQPDPSYAGLTLAQISERRKADPVTTLIDLIREAETLRKGPDDEVESVIGTSMDEPDVERLLLWPHTNVCTDGELAGRHPRGFGTYPRILGRYVRQQKLLSLEEAVRKMTGLAAESLGLTGHGALGPGANADLVLFDPRTVLDRATPEDPQAVSIGIEKVWVNGSLVFAEGKATGLRPGRVITRPAVR